MIALGPASRPCIARGCAKGRDMGKVMLLEVSGSSKRHWRDISRDFLPTSRINVRQGARRECGRTSLPSQGTRCKAEDHKGPAEVEFSPSRHELSLRLGFAGRPVHHAITRSFG